MTFRFIVSIDVEAPTAVEAYTQLRDRMNQTAFGWETEQAFANDGELSDDELTTVIVSATDRSEAES